MSKENSERGRWALWKEKAQVAGGRVAGGIKETFASPPSVLEGADWFRERKIETVAGENGWTGNEDLIGKYGAYMGGVLASHDGRNHQIGIDFYRAHVDDFLKTLSAEERMAIKKME